MAEDSPATRERNNEIITGEVKWRPKGVCSIVIATWPLALRVLGHPLGTSVAAAACTSHIEIERCVNSQKLLLAASEPASVRDAFAS